MQISTEPKCVLYATQTKEYFLNTVKELLRSGYSWGNTSGCDSVAIHEEYWDEYKEKTVIIPFQEEKLIRYSHRNNPEYWQLVSPKERTIEDVQVGDVVLRIGFLPSVVLGILGDLVFLEYSDSPGTGGMFYTKKYLEEEGWKIKQPESENKKDDDDKAKWIHEGERNGWLVPGKCPYGNDNCPKCK